MALYQEVRPDSLDDVVGNGTTIGALRVMLKNPPSRRPHAILLKGPNGCGKTTIARILAVAFGSAEESIIRVSANNTNGIGTVRNIAENAPLVGFGGSSKTYIIDESHELTTKAQDGFLDILEDYPPHCYFIFCTTDPEKIIKGIHNRCTEYSVGYLQDDEIIEVLVRACEEMDIEVDPKIVQVIINTCEGSPRAALVSLEQVSDIPDICKAREVLERGTEHNAVVLDLLLLLVMAPQVRRKKWKRIVTTFNSIEADSEQVRRSILTFLYNKLVKQDYRVEDAMDIVHLQKIFSENTFYGGKSQLGALVARACFETWKD